MLALPPRNAGDGEVDRSVETVTDVLRAQTSRLSFSAPFFAGTQGDAAKMMKKVSPPAPEEPTVCNQQPGLLRVRWQQGQPGLQGAVNAMNDFFEFELEYRAVVAGMPTAITEQFSFNLPWQWQAVKPLVTSLECEQAANGSPVETAYWHMQSVSCRLHGLTLGKTYVFRVRQRSLQQHSTQSHRLIKSRSSRSKATAEAMEAEEAEVEESALWSEWSPISAPMKVLADDDADYLKRKIAAAEEELQQLFEQQTQSAVAVAVAEQQAQIFRQAGDVVDDDTPEARAETKRLQRLERMEPEPEPEPELEPDPQPCPDSGCDGDSSSASGAPPTTSSATPLGHQNNSGFDYMDELRACAATHYDLVINRGDLLPRVLGQGNAYCSRGSTDGNEVTGTNSKGNVAASDETSDLQMLLRHIALSTATDADAVVDASDRSNTLAAGDEKVVEATRGEDKAGGYISVDPARVGEAFSRYAHHGSVHIMHTDHAESGATVIATVANPSDGLDDTRRWLHLQYGVGGKSIAADGVGTGYVFVSQTLEDHSLHRYSATIARLCALARNGPVEARAKRHVGQRPPPPPPPPKVKPQPPPADGCPLTVNRNRTNVKVKARDAEISDEQRF